MISGRKGIFIILAVVILFSFALVDCSKKAPQEPSMMEETSMQAQEPMAEPAPVQEYTPEPEPMKEPEPMMEPEPMKEMAFDASDLFDVFFDFDKSDLSMEARDTLATDARLLKAAANVNIVVEGHCDERGTNEYNLGLGERRANAVKNYLVSLGISPSRIKTISYGEEKPFAMGHTEQAWKLNRRGHFGLQ